MEPTSKACQRSCAGEGIAVALPTKVIAVAAAGALLKRSAKNWNIGSRNNSRELQGT
jgi:hypothetical protein